MFDLFSVFLNLQWFSFSNVERVIKSPNCELFSFDLSSLDLATLLPVEMWKFKYIFCGNIFD